MKGESVMSEIVLKTPTVEYAEQIMAYRREFLENNSELNGDGGLHKCESAEEWLGKIQQMSSPKTCPKQYAVSTQYIAVRKSDNRLVGMIALRYDINHPILSLYGGHIGYSVRPSERRKGYAKEMLRQCLEEAQKTGLARVMISCDKSNLGSERTILANGGVFQCEVAVEGEDEPIKRFWIELK